MHTYAGIIQLLQQKLPERDLKDVVSALIRVPQAWQYLGAHFTDDNLQDCTSSEEFLPGSLAARLFLSEEDAVDAESAYTPAGLRDLDSDADFPALAHASLWLAEQLNNNPNGAALLESISGSPVIGSLLGLAFARLENPGELIEKAYSSGDATLIEAWINALLANLTAEQAANWADQHSPAYSAEIALRLRLQKGTPLENTLLIEKDADTDGSYVSRSLRLLALGMHDDARGLLHTMWEHLSENMASVADRLGDVSDLDNDRLTGAEARRQANEIHPTPLRRAEWIVSLVQNNQLVEAVSQASGRPSTIEEYIAFGLVALANGDSGQALNLLTAACGQLENVDDLNPRWLRLLAEALRTLDAVQAALAVYRRIIHVLPTDASARTTFASLLAAAGDSEKAVDEAEIANVLESDLLGCRIVLAQSLQNIGAYDRALEMWKHAALDNCTYSVGLAACALEAGDLATAEAASSQLLSGEPSEKAAGQVLKGRIAVVRGDFEQAQLFFDNVLESDPENVEAWLATAQAKDVRGDHEAAAKTIANAIQLNPNNPQLRLELSRHYRRLGRHAEALEQTARAVELSPNDAEILLEHGRSLLYHSRDEEARKTLRAAWEKKPLSWQVRHALSLSYEQSGELASAAGLLSDLPEHASSEALIDAGRILAKSLHPNENLDSNPSIDFLDRAAAKGADPAQILYWKGFAAEQAGHLNQALQRYGESLQATSSDRISRLDALLGYARTARQMDRPALAVQMLSEARSEYPTSTDLLQSLGEAYLAAGETEHALATATQAVELAPQGKDILRLLSRCAQSNGNDGLARDALSKLTELSDSDPEAWLDLARLAFDGGHIEEARSSLAAALACGRRNIRILLDAAEVAAELGLHSSAERFLHIAISNPEIGKEMLSRLGSLAENIGSTALAHQAWRQRVDSDPEDAHAIGRCAHALWLLNRRSAAIGLWQRALQLTPEDVTTHRMLGRALQAYGEQDSALSHYTEALRLDPGNGDLALEAGLACLKNNCSEDALERLKTAVLLSPGSVDAALGLAECLLQLGNHKEAHTALLEITLRGSAPSRAFSMLALTSVAANDITSARAALDQAFAQPMETGSDSRWASQAAFRLMEWDRGVEVLELGIRRKQTAETLTELAAAYLRMSMYRWLYASIGHALEHAPALPATEAFVPDNVAQIIRRLREMDSPVHLLDTLRRWTALLFDHESDQDEFPASASYEFTREMTLARAIRHIRLGNPLAAITLLKRETKLDQIGLTSKLTLGYAHAAAGDMKNALACYENVQADALTSPLSSYFKALAYRTTGNQNDAITALNGAIATWPDEHQWHFELSALYLEAEDIDSALPHLQESAELAPDHADYIHTLARSLFLAGDIDAAAKRYNHVITLKPEASVVWKEAAQAALATENYAEAEAWFERACTLLPSDPGCLVGSARAMLKQGKTKHALERADSALRLDPSNPDALVCVGDIYSAIDKLDEALDTYDHALSRASNPLPIHAARARILQKLKRADEAVRELQSALKEFPENELGWSTLAEMYEEEALYDEAADAATRLINLAPHNAGHHLLLGRICRKQGHLDRAMNELLIGEKIAPTNPALAFELGLVFEERREAVQAVRCYERMATLAPDNPESYFRSGLLFKEMKQYAAAVEHFRKAAELNPKDPDTHHQLAAVHALQLVHGFNPETMVTQ
ncbi:MAG: tetratricopeptide repeat protein [Anaerolineales bacterium]|nr:tetratricopeptide repeat protein [Anaerolineales bacterium]